MKVSLRNVILVRRGGELAMSLGSWKRNNKYNSTDSKSLHLNLAWRECRTGQGVNKQHQIELQGTEGGEILESSAAEISPKSERRALAWEARAKKSPSRRQGSRKTLILLLLKESRIFLTTVTVWQLQHMKIFQARELI